MRIPISKSGSVRGLELLSRNLGRGSIEGVVKRWSTVSKWSVSSSWQEFRRFRVPSAVCRNRSSGYKVNGVDDFLRLPARHTVTETRQFAIYSPRGEAKTAGGGERGDVSNFGNFNCVIRNWRWIVNEKIRSRSNDWLDNRESCLGLPLYIYTITLKLFEN